MTMPILLVVLLCVVGISAGQILFKLTSRSIDAASPIVSMALNPIFIAALLIYGLATIAWIWALRHVELSLAYPLMALSYLIVPFGSHFLLGEQVAARYWIGVALICAGIILSSGAANR